MSISKKDCEPGPGTRSSDIKLNQVNNNVNSIGYIMVEELNRINKKIDEQNKITQRNNMLKIIFVPIGVILFIIFMIYLNK